MKRTNLTSLTTGLCILCIFSLPAQAMYGGGSGTAEDPYLITSAADMQEIGTHPEHWGSYFKLMTDIDLAAYDGHDGRPYFNIIGNDSTKFTGVFDGNDHKILNFTYNLANSNNKGIFGYVDNVNAQIKNVEIKDPNINMPNSPYNVGSLVGLLINGTVSNCYVTGGNIIGYNSCGGLVGFSYGTIDNCHSTCNVSGHEAIGGLAGTNTGTISNCSANGNISGGWSVGGLVGLAWFHTCSILNSYATGSVSGVDYARNIGGLVGATQDSPKVSNCYATGTVRGNQYIGGLIGYSNYGTSIDECHATGDVNGVSYVGGLFGFGHGTVVSSYATGIVEGQNYVGGLVGKSGEVTTIERCFALGNVSGNLRIGGLIGYSDNSTVLLSFSKGDVSGTNEVGGLVGHNNSVIRNTYSWGDVSGTENVGGLVGWDEKIVGYSYSAGYVTGTTNVGGLVGYKNTSHYTKCFWDNKVNPSVNGIGNTSDPEVVGKSTANMQTANTFTSAGWDFTTPIWTIKEGKDYPRLWWEKQLEPPVLHTEQEITLGTSNIISWDAVADANEYYAECVNDVNFTNILYDSGWISQTSYEFTGLELGQIYWYRVKAKTTSGIESEWSNVESSLQGTLVDVVDTFVKPNNLKNKQLKNALKNKISSVLTMIEQGLYKEAIDKLQNDILQKTNGCADSNKPDKNDWITTCEDQEDIYPYIIETIEYLESMM